MKEPATLPTPKAKPKQPEQPEEVWRYDIPEDYKKNGGEFDREIQKFTYTTCKSYGVDYAVILAIIETESAYKSEAYGSSTDTGYMQIIPRFHEERTERLNVTDLFDPKENITTGVDFIAELLEKYEGNYTKAITAYHWGCSGAYDRFFQFGEESCKYTDVVLNRAERIRKEIKEGRKN